MLALDRATGAYADRHFRELPEMLRAGDLLVLNDSRVIPARLFAHRAGLHTQEHHKATGRVQVLLAEQLSEWEWKALVRPGRKVLTGEHLVFGDDELRAEVIAHGEFGERTLRFAPMADFFGVVERLGHMPLPPYIHREDAPGDRERYQTVYAQERGSVAAPTAGLHFTPEILSAIRASGVEIAALTLHVGLGTFQPVRVDRVEDVRLHAERYTLSSETAEKLNAARLERRRVVAAGTTTVRTLEYTARKTPLKQNALERGTRDFVVGTDVSDELRVPHPSRVCLGGDFPDEPIIPQSGEADIFIYPGFEFKVVGAMLTNFHLPKSTLLMLVSAFAGRERVLQAYAHAVRERYRFYSYGDCMFLE